MRSFLHGRERLAFMANDSLADSSTANAESPMSLSCFSRSSLSCSRAAPTPPLTASRTSVSWALRRLFVFLLTSGVGTLARVIRTRLSGWKSGWNQAMCFLIVNILNYMYCPSIVLSLHVHVPRLC